MDNLMLHLNSISRLAAMENAPQTQKHTGRIISSIRYKNSRMDQLLSLSEEIKALENFIDIFKLRFGDSIHFVLKINQDAAACYIPHYSLMAFVENALYHAFEASVGVKELMVVINKSEETLKIEVRDNGCGFEPDSCIGSGESDMQYGTIASTVNRLSSYYGKSGIVNIESKPGKGTAVQICIPL